MHAIDTLYQEHLARRQLPPRDLIEQHTGRISDEGVARAIAGRLACALPSAEALDYLRGHLERPLLTVAAGIGFWAHCLLQVAGIETLATDLFTPEDNPRFRRPGWHPVQPMDAVAALRRYPDRDVLGVCLPPGLSLQQVYEAAPQAAARGSCSWPATSRRRRSAAGARTSCRRRTGCDSGGWIAFPAGAWRHHATEPCSSTHGAYDLARMIWRA